MPTLTDPAREMAEVCAKLNTRSDESGQVFLAKQFRVAPWSAQFYQVLFTIQQRLDELAGLAQNLDMDEDYKNELVSHVLSVKNAFAQPAMSNAWHANGLVHLQAQNVQPIKVMSPLIRTKVSYAKLDDAETLTLLNDLAALELWLKEHQLEEQDFLRQLMLEGLAQLRFRLERLTWLGWGYTLESLRELIGTYMALERGLQDPSLTPIAEATLKKVGALIKVVYEKAKWTKEASETGDFLLKAYGAYSLFIEHHHLLGGLLPAPG